MIFFLKICLGCEKMVKSVVYYNGKKKKDAKKKK